jgi:hypothetical protein
VHSGYRNLFLTSFFILANTSDHFHSVLIELYFNLKLNHRFIYQQYLTSQKKKQLPRRRRRRGRERRAPRGRTRSQRRSQLLQRRRAQAVEREREAATSDNTDSNSDTMPTNFFCFILYLSVATYDHGAKIIHYPYQLLLNQQCSEMFKNALQSWYMYIIPYSGKFSSDPIFVDGQSSKFSRFNFRG